MSSEAVAKCSISAKIKAERLFQPEAYTEVLRGLKWEPNADIGLHGVLYNRFLYLMVVTGQLAFRMMYWAVEPSSSFRVRDRFSMPT